MCSQAFCQVVTRLLVGCSQKDLQGLIGGCRVLYGCCNGSVRDVVKLGVLLWESSCIGAHNSDNPSVLLPATRTTQARIHPTVQGLGCSSHKDPEGGSNKDLIRPS